MHGEHQERVRAKTASLSKDFALLLVGAAAPRWCCGSTGGGKVEAQFLW